MESFKNVQPPLVRMHAIGRKARDADNLFWNSPSQKKNNLLAGQVHALKARNPGFLERTSFTWEPQHKNRLAVIYTIKRTFPAKIQNVL